MLKSAVVAFYSTLVRHPLYAVLNVLGLAFGIAVFIVIGLYVRFELSRDRWMPGAADLYEVTTALMTPGRSDRAYFSAAGAALDMIRTMHPDLYGARIVKRAVTVTQGDSVVREAVQEIDPAIFAMFAVRFVAGHPGALHKDGVILSQSAARKYFHRTDVVGETLMLQDDPAAAGAPPPPRRYFVTGVIRDLPGNSSVRLDIVRPVITAQQAIADPYWSDWGVMAHRTFVRPKSGEDVMRINATLDAIVDRHGTSSYHEALGGVEPRHDLFRVRLKPVGERHPLANPPMAGLISLMVAGLTALIVALINYVNLATARAGFRAREVAVRKAMGATRRDLKVQFLGEAVLTSLIAALVGLSLAEVTLPLINAAGGLSLRIDYAQDAVSIVLIFAMAALCGLLAGVWPAVVLSDFQPARVLAAVRAPLGGRISARLREILVGVQFTVVTVFFMIVAGFLAQVRHMETSQLGFARSGTLVTSSLLSPFIDDARSRRIVAAWRNLPGMVAMTAGPVPGRGLRLETLEVSRPGSGHAPFVMKSYFVWEDFFTTFQTPHLAGRDLAPQDTVYEDRLPVGAHDVEIAVVINLRAVQALGFATAQAATGQTFASGRTRLRIMGVVADQRLEPPTVALSPMMYVLAGHTLSEMPAVVRFSGVGADIMQARMKAVWQRLAPGVPFAAEPGDVVLGSYYTQDRRHSQLYGMGAIVVGVIGVMGLYGMAAFSTSTQAIEIAMRRTAGASRLHVAAGLVLRFLVPVAVACVVAVPVAYAILTAWLGAFEDRVALSAWPFAAGIGLSLLVAVMTVLGLALARASASPGKVLRHE